MSLQSDLSDFFTRYNFNHHAINDLNAILENHGIAATPESPLPLYTFVAGSPGYATLSAVENEIKNNPIWKGCAHNYVLYRLATEHPETKNFVERNVAETMTAAATMAGTNAEADLPNFCTNAYNFDGSTRKEPLRGVKSCPKDFTGDDGGQAFVNVCNRNYQAELDAGWSADVASGKALPLIDPANMNAGVSG